MRAFKLSSQGINYSKLNWMFQLNNSLIYNSKDFLIDYKLRNKTYTLWGSSKLHIPQGIRGKYLDVKLCLMILQVRKLTELIMILSNLELPISSMS